MSSLRASVSSESITTKHTSAVIVGIFVLLVSDKADVNECVGLLDVVSEGEISITYSMMDEDGQNKTHKGKAYFDKSPGTQFHSIPECGHLFHSNGQNIMELAAPLIVDFLKEEEKPPS